MADYFHVERETVEFLKAMLQEETKKALEQKLFEGHDPFPRVKFGTTGILYNVATFESGINQSGYYGADHLVLTSDGKLIQFRVVGEDDGDGEWTNEGRSGNEAEPRQYLDWAPNLICKIQKALLVGNCDKL